MAAERWEKFDRPEQDRIARRFRHHVRTTWNPKGRIRREPCQFCGAEESTWGKARKAGPIEAHHVDYAQPFLVVWVCFTCHRKVDRGELKILKRHLWDYTSLVQQRPHLQLTTPF